MKKYKNRTNKQINIIDGLIMKRKICLFILPLFVAIILSGLSGCSTFDYYFITNFSGINISCGNVYITKGLGHNLEIDAPDFIKKYIVVKVINDVLTIYYDNSFLSVGKEYISKINIYIMTPYLDKIYLSSYVYCEMKGFNNLSNLTIDISNYSKLIANFNVKNLNVSCSNYSELKFSGNANNLNAKLRNYSTLYAINLIVLYGYLSLENYCKANVKIIVDLKAEILNYSELRNYAIPKCQINIDQNSIFYQGTII